MITSLPTSAASVFGNTASFSTPFGSQSKEAEFPMLPLTKILSEEDYNDESFWPAQGILAMGEAKLYKADLLDPLPTPHRRWEYAQGIRAAFAAQKGGTMLEVGGSSSEFMPAVLNTRHFSHHTALEAPEWTTPANMVRVHNQAQAIGTEPIYSCEGSIETVDPKHFDFIACISVIENLAYSGTKVGERWHDGHHFMFEFVLNLTRHLKPNGIIFITSDIKEAQPDNAHFHWQRPPGIWTPESWAMLAEYLCAAGMTPVDNSYDFNWTGHDLSNFGYTFASMALRLT
jgi:hypothetical protein